MSECHKHVWELYKIHGSSNVTASFFFKRFFTWHCDDYSDFKDMRNRITSFISDETTAIDILGSPVPSVYSEGVAVKTFVTFNNILERQLYNSLPLSYRFWYHTGHKVGVAYEAITKMNNNRNGEGIISHSRFLIDVRTTERIMYNYMQTQK